MQRIEGIESCKGCCFLDSIYPENGKEAICKQTGDLVREAKVCLDGPFVQLHKNGDLSGDAILTGETQDIGK